MLAHMKTRITGRSTEIVLTMPTVAAREMMNMIMEMWRLAGHEIRDGYDDGADDDDPAACVPYELAFPDRSPGTMLRGVRGREGITQKEMADKLGLSRYCVAEMEHNRRPITPEMARKISKTFNISERIFLD